MYRYIVLQAGINQVGGGITGLLAPMRMAAGKRVYCRRSIRSEVMYQQWIRPFGTHIPARTTRPVTEGGPWTYYGG